MAIVPYANGKVIQILSVQIGIVSCQIYELKPFSLYFLYIYIWSYNANKPVIFQH